MKIPVLTRREFINAASVAATAAMLPSLARAAQPRTAWPIGCFNRPWQKWTFDDALDGIKAAGYEWTGLLTPQKNSPLLGTTQNPATPEYLAAVKQKIAARGLKANMGALRLTPTMPLDVAIKDARQQALNAQTLGLRYLLTFGVDKPEYYSWYYRVVADTAAFAQDHGLQVVLKPHGGGSGAAEEILRCVKEVNQPNFKVWYDAGNIVFYTGKDPVAELDPIVQHVTGFIAKDCAVRMVDGKPKGDVYVQFGAGKVDFAGVFRKLKSAGFNGPVMVECCEVGATPQATTENARANRKYLLDTLAKI